MEGNFRRGKISFIQGDILDQRSLLKALQGIDLVYHLAAKVTTPYFDRDLHHYEQVNHWGTTELVSCILKHNKKEEEKGGNTVQKLIYLSSAAVYGFSDEPCHEGSPLHPVSHYGITKLRAEKELDLLRDTCEVHVVRSANIFGYSRSMRFDSVINKFMFHSHFKKAIQLFGDGRQQRSFVSIQYLVQLLSLGAIQIDFPALINAYQFNYSINEVAFEFIKKLIPELDILYVNNGFSTKGITLESRQDVSKMQLPKPKDLLEYLKEFQQAFSF
jgi:UDP-glucose 4-epimerase